MNCRKFLSLSILAMLWLNTVEANPLKVYILVGQSNMQGHATSATLPHMASDPATRPLHDKIVDKDGKPRVYSDVYVTAVSEQGATPKKKSGKLTIGFGKALNYETSFGPELGFGITMYETLKEPILIIKTAWGGKSLNTDFRSPSSGAYELHKKRQAEWDKHPDGAHGIPKTSDRPKWWEAKHAATGHYYRLMMDSVKEVLRDPAKVCAAYDPKEGYEIAGMVWFQGWNDMCDSTTYPNRGKEGRFTAYSSLMANFIRDVRKDLATPNMPFVIGVMGVGGTIEDVKDQRNGVDAAGFRKAMAAPAEMPEFKGNVFVVRTGKFWDFDIGNLDSLSYKNRRKFQAEYAKTNKVDWEKLKGTADWGKHRKAMDAFVRESTKALFEKTYPGKSYDKLIVGKANAGYHYLGCGKTIAQIGKAFAEALVEMKTSK